MVIRSLSIVFEGTEGTEYNFIIVVGDTVILIKILDNLIMNVKACTDSVLRSDSSINRILNR